MASQTLSEPIQKEDIDPGDASLENRSAWENTGYHQTVSNTCGSKNSWQCHNSKKSLMNAPRLTMTYIEIQDLLRGGCFKERHRQTSQLAKILIWLSAVSKLWTKLQNSVSVCRKSRTKRTSKRNCHFENVTKKLIKPDLGSTGQQVNGAGVGDQANTRVRE